MDATDMASNNYSQNFSNIFIMQFTQVFKSGLSFLITFFIHDVKNIY